MFEKFGEYQIEIKTENLIDRHSICIPKNSELANSFK